MAKIDKTMNKLDEELCRAVSEILGDSEDLVQGTYRAAFMLMIMIYHNAEDCPEGTKKGVEILSCAIQHAQDEVLAGFQGIEEKKQKRRLKDKARRFTKKALEKAAKEV